MRIWIVVLSLLISSVTWARPAKTLAVPRDLQGWSEFDAFMKESERQHREVGWSYIISGVLVAAGGTLGSQSTDDVGSKLVFGLSAGLGVGAAGYGALKLMNGGDARSFYETLQGSSLSTVEKDELVRGYLMREKEKAEIQKKTRIVTHLVAAALNIYAASQEKEQTAKGFLQLFAGVNCALALAYTF